MSAAAATRQDSVSRGWTHYIPDSFFHRPDLEPNLERLVLRLEGLARDKPWCFTSNDELMDLLRCSHNTLAAELRRGEQRGWFRRALIPGQHGRATGRIGIVLFIRPTDRPVATPQTFDQVVHQMRAEIRRGQSRSRPQTLPFPAPIPRESATTGPQELGTAVPKNWAPAVPKNWAPPTYSKEEITEQETETTTTLMHGAEARRTSTHFPSRRRPFSIGDQNRKRPGIPVPRSSGMTPFPRPPRPMHPRICPSYPLPRSRFRRPPPLRPSPSVCRPSWWPQRPR